MNQLSADEEKVLLERAMQGDEGAWEALINAYRDPLIGFLYNYLGNEEDAKDVAQEAFARAIANLHKFHGKNRWSTWLFSIAANRAKDILKSAAHRRTHSVAEVLDNYEPLMPVKVMHPDDQTIEKQMVRDIKLAVQSLPAKLRACFSLYYFEQKTVDEISTVLRCSKGAVKVQLSRAREYIARGFPELYDYIK